MLLYVKSKGDMERLGEEVNTLEQIRVMDVNGGSKESSAIVEFLGDPN